MWKRPFQENKDWNTVKGVDGTIYFKWKRPFQENKDWNYKLVSFSDPARSWKRPFQENKDWNFHLRWFSNSSSQPSESAHSKKTRIETRIQILKTPSLSSVKAPIPRKQGLKLLPCTFEFCCKYRWKRPFQENKDWNSLYRHQANRKMSCESAHSKKTRIETHQVWLISTTMIGESAHSKKTRIETNNTITITIIKLSESAHSKKTRIETQA